MVNRVPLCTSRQLTAASERLGCFPVRSAKGSHQVYARRLLNGTTLTATVVLGKGQVKRGTTGDILTKLQIPVADFRDALR